MAGKIHDYDTHSSIKAIEKIIDNDMLEYGSMSGKVMDAIYPVRNKNIGTVLGRVISEFEDAVSYDTPSEWFTPEKFDTFMDYFKRKITDKKQKEIQAKTEQFAVVMPCEANVEALGTFTDTSKILRLKEPTEDVEKELRKSGINNIEKMSFASLKLLKCYYHRIHCPVDGTIQDISFKGKDEPIFGANTLWIVSISTDSGMVYMLLVGELQIQDFTFRLHKGDKVTKFEELGNFNWGSQVVMVFEENAFGDILIKEGEKYFPGDGIFAKQKD